MVATTRIFAPSEPGTEAYMEWMLRCAKEMQEYGHTGDQELGEGIEWAINRIRQMDSREVT